MTVNEMRLRRPSPRALCPPTINAFFALDGGLTISPNPVTSFFSATLCCVLNNLNDFRWPPKYLRSSERHGNRGLKSWVHFAAPLLRRASASLASHLALTGWFFVLSQNYIGVSQCERWSGWKRRSERQTKQGPGGRGFAVSMPPAVPLSHGRDFSDHRSRDNLSRRACPSTHYEWACHH
jgi:hypothetical protein